MIARNAAAPAERRIEFRMGINVDDWEITYYNTQFISFTNYVVWKATKRRFLGTDHPRYKHYGFAHFFINGVLQCR